MLLFIIIINRCIFKYVISMYKFVLIYEIMFCILAFIYFFDDVVILIYLLVSCISFVKRNINTFIFNWKVCVFNMIFLAFCANFLLKINLCVFISFVFKGLSFLFLSYLNFSLYFYYLLGLVVAPHLLEERKK